MSCDFFFLRAYSYFLMFVCVLAIQSRFNLNRILSGSLLLPLPSSSSLWCALVDALDIVKYERCVGTTWQTKNFMNTQKRKKHIFLFPLASHRGQCFLCVKGKKLFFFFQTQSFYLHRLKVFFSFYFWLGCVSIVCQQNMKWTKWYKYLSWSEIWIVWFELNRAIRMGKKLGRS